MKLVGNVKHLYAALADGKSIEFASVGRRWGVWTPSESETHVGDRTFCWRVSDEWVTFTATFPKPETKVPALGTIYWRPGYDTLVYQEHWDNLSFDKAMLAAGLVHLDKDAAKIHAAAIFGVKW